MQLHAPRDDGERDDGERLQGILARWGTCPIDDGRITRRSRTSQAALDVMSAPGGEAWSWTTRTAWHSGLSDHAFCSAWRSAERRAAGVVSSPASLTRLPPEAWSDLRCRYSYLGHVFGARSGWDLPLCSAGLAACAPAETLPADHPAMAGLMDDERWEGERAAGLRGRRKCSGKPSVVQPWSCHVRETLLVGCTQQLVADLVAQVCCPG